MGEFPVLLRHFSIIFFFLEAIYSFTLSSFRNVGINSVARDQPLTPCRQPPYFPATTPAPPILPPCLPLNPSHLGTPSLLPPSLQPHPDFSLTPQPSSFPVSPKLPMYIILYRTWSENDIG